MVRLALNSAKKACNESNLGVAILLCIILIALAFGLDCLIVWWAMTLWNGCLVGAIPLLLKVKYWQMWGIYLLFGFLFRARITNSNTNSN